MNKSLFIFYFCCLMYNCACFAANKTYKGKMGENIYITMQLQMEGDKCTGKYFYHKQRKDIALQGVFANNQWVIEETGGGLFKGSFNNDETVFSGDWSHPEKGSMYKVELGLLLPSPGKSEIDYQKAKQFQAFLNAFEQPLLLPLKLNNKLKNIEIQNDKKVNIEASDLKKLPYNLARQYVMNQTKLSLSHYFNMDEDRYLELPYKAVGKIFSNAQAVGLLMHLEDDNGWDEYEVFFAQVFDYEGTLLCEWKAYTYFIMERTSELSSEKTTSTIFSDLKVDLKTESIRILYGNNPQTGSPYYNEKNSTASATYQISKEGKWIKIK